ncbi:unnamed protein product [Caenorhabditis auriculariae]|uniref:Uncharacterized protein n=1 Tax=Caenorhabditis auriculariae TaxID=2777116 RepID=A0A8S1HZQ8_9PELO|nr:unnamed protein product [Caenorhabditis auriculariae]
MSISGKLVLLTSLAVFTLVRSQSWSEWADKDGASCSDDCGACGEIDQERTCDGGDGECPGDSERQAPCNFEICLFPRENCCDGYKKTIDEENKEFVCEPDE